jgi:hypothetical protein
MASRSMTWQIEAKVSDTPYDASFPQYFSRCWITAIIMVLALP